MNSLILQVQELQKEREEKLIEHLRKRLQPFVEGKKEEFIKWANTEASRLSQAGIFSTTAIGFLS